MGKKYKSTLQMVVRKLHTCFNCGARFSYLLKREITAENADANVAVVEATAKVGTARLSEIDPHPCPACGFVQPEMMAKQKVDSFVYGLILGVIGLGISLAVGWWGSIFISAYIATATVALVLWIDASAAFSDPNLSLSNNLDRATRVPATTELRVDHPASATLEFKELPNTPSISQVFALAVLLAGLLVAFAPAALPLALSWPQNPGWSPTIIGPGDTSTYRFGEITSLKGLWAGQATASASGEGLAEPMSLTAETKSATWGGTISGKRITNQRNSMWVQVRFPNEPEFTRTSLDLHVTANVRFPLDVGRGFKERQQLFEDDTTVRLAVPMAGLLFFRLWWMGQVGILVWMILATVILISGVKQLKSVALPHEVEDVPQA